MEKMRDVFKKGADTDHPALISAVNWAEVLYRMRRKRGNEGFDTARQFELTMPLEIVPIDRELAEAAAQLKTAHDLGLADSFAAALTKSKKGELIK